MKFNFLFSTACLTTTALAMMSTNAFAQHQDVEFGYNDLANPTAFEIDSTNFTSEGFLYFESELEARDPFDTSDLSSDEPGFTTNDGEGLLVNQGDQIWFNVLDASVHSSFGAGYVNFYNPVTDALEASGRLAILDNSGSTTDLVLNGGSIESGVNPQFIGSADADGDVHDHVVVDLLDDSTAPQGAYGILLQLQSDFDAADSTIDLSSDPFWFVFNHGLSESDFDSVALTQFGVSSVPEPGTLSLVGLGLVTILVRRRRELAKSA